MAERQSYQCSSIPSKEATPRNKWSPASNDAVHSNIWCTSQQWVCSVPQSSKQPLDNGIHSWLCSRSCECIWQPSSGTLIILITNHSQSSPYKQAHNCHSTTTHATANWRIWLWAVCCCNSNCNLQWTKAWDYPVWSSSNEATSSEISGWKASASISVKEDKKKQEIVFRERIHVYCTCRQPDDGCKMIQCTTCKCWYHCNCMKFSSRLVKSIENSKNPWYCTASCQKKN